MPRLAPRHVVLACLVLAAGFFGVFGFHSYRPADHGFILAYAWRIAGGQTPYLDFLYIRPPLPLYLHTLWLALPDGWAFPASRLGFYLEMALSAALPAAAAWRAGLVGNGPRALGLTLAFLAIALHNFPAMPWHTVDGVFFASIGLACLVASFVPRARDAAPAALHWRAGASLAFALSALAKQNFALPVLAFAAFVLLEAFHSDATRERNARLAASLLPGLGVALALVGLLAAQGALGAFLDQVIGTTLAASAPGRGGFVSQLRGPALALLPGLLWPWLRDRARAQRAFAEALPAIEWAALAALLWLAPDTATSSRSLLAFLTGSLAGRAWQLRGARDEESRREWLRVLLGVGVVLIGVAASISWGYPQPSLGLAAMGIALADLGDAPLARWRPAAWAALLAGVAIAWALALGVRHPYGDVPLRAQTMPLHEVFPRFGRLYSNPMLYDTMRELRMLLDRHALAADRDFVVLNDFPLVHYLSDRQSRARLDWYYWLEMRGREEELLAELEALDAVRILYRKRAVSPIGFAVGLGGPCSEKTFDFSPGFLQPLFRASHLLESGHFFCVLDGRRSEAHGPQPRHPSSSDSSSSHDSP